MPLDHAGLINQFSTPASQPAGDTGTGPGAGTAKSTAPIADSVQVLDSVAEPGIGESLSDVETPDPAVEGSQEPGNALLDDAEYLLGEEKLSGKAIRENLLRQADYTKKTQALAAERREFQSQLAEERADKEELVGWVKSLQDPQTLYFELQRTFPDAYDAMRDYIIQQAIEEQNMDKNALAWKRKAERAQIEEWGRQEDAKRNESRESVKTRTQKTAQLAATFNGWAKEALTGAGLDPENPDHQKMVRSHLATEYPKTQLTAEHFQRGAAYIAKLLGKTAAPPPNPAAALPPVHKTGAKAPAVGGQNTPRTPKQSARAKEIGSFFDQLRSKYR